MQQSTPVHEVPPIVHEVLRSPGRPPDAKARVFIEPCLGHDFSNTRVYPNNETVKPV